MHNIPQKRRFRRISLTLLLAVGFLWLWGLGQQPGRPPAESAGDDRVQTALSLPHPVQKETSGISIAQVPDLLLQLQGQPRPAPQVQRGRNQRRVFDEPAVRAVEPLDSEPVNPFTGFVRLRLDEQVPDHHLAVSAIALGVNHSTFAALAVQDSPRISIPLEEDLSVTFRVQKVMDRGPVTHSYFGVIEERPESIAQLVYNDGAVTGHFVLYSDDTHPTRHYEIKYLTEDLAAMHKLDEAAFHREDGHHCGTCSMASELALDTEAEEALVPVAGEPEDFAANGRVVDIVIGYGRETRQADGGVANIEARMIAAVDRMNQAFENSQIDGRLVLLGMIEDPDYLEADFTMTQTLDALIFGTHSTVTDPLQAVRDLRVSLGADLAKFIMENGEAAGMAYITHWASVTERSYVTTSRFVFEHEVGHNLGAYHAWGDSFDSQSTAHSRYGWRFSRANGSSKRRTIMAYDWSWSHVLHYSNPDVVYDLNGEGVTTGAVAGYNAGDDPTVDPRLVSGGSMGTLGSGYDGTNADLGANVAGYFNTASNSGIAVAAGRAERAGLAVTAPLAGETLIAWESTLIEWVGGTWNSPARLELYQNAVKVADIAELPRNGDRVFLWTPGPGLSGSDFRIRIVNNEGEDFEESAFSATFDIDSPPIPEYEVVYHANGATGTAPPQQVKYENIALTLSAAEGLSHPGHTFVGWNTLADGSGQAYFPGDLYELNTDLALYAQWVTGYTVVIDFGKPDQETGGYWNNITGDGDWPDGTILSPSLLRYHDGGQTGARLFIQQVTGSGRAGIGGHDIEPENQEDQAAFSVSGTLPGSAQRDIAYFTSDGQAQFVFENLDDSLEYQLEFQTLHKNTTPAANWTLQPGTVQEQIRLVSRNKGAAHYSPVQVFENIQTDGAGRIVLRSAGDVAQNINALELTAAVPQSPGPSGDPAQPENPGGGTGITYYLDVNTGNDSNTGLSEAAAWQTFQHAINTLQPGDTVLIREGDYTSTGNPEWYNWSINTSGTPGQYITYRAYPGERPRFHVDTWNGIQLWEVSHIEIDGLEVIGLPDPEGLAEEPENSPVRQALAEDPQYVGGGITVTFDTGAQSHFIRIRNTLVHQVGGNGIGFRGGSMILVEGNTVHSSTHRSDAGNSAISFVELNSALHQSAGYGVVVRNNILFNNRNMLHFKDFGYITDGNGVIIDFCQDYTEDRILIANNLIHHNGGRGVHMFNARNVDVIHNTLFHNLITESLQWAGELSSDAPGGETNNSIHFHNNIAIARAERRAYSIANTTNWQFTRNVTQSPRTPETMVDGAQNLLQTDPLFADPGALDFRLQAASPAIDYGLVFAEVPEDADGTSRQGGAPDAGAFEFVGSPPPPDSVLVRYTFENVPSVDSQHSTETFVRQASAESVAAEIIASPFHIWNDGGSAARLIATDSANGIAGAAQIAGIESHLFQWESGASSNPYFEFTVEGAATLETLRIVARSGVQWNNTGSFLSYDSNRQAEFSVRSSLDNYASNIAPVFVAGNAGAFAEQILDLSGLSPAGQAITFRIYARAYQSSDNWFRA